MQSIIGIELDFTLCDVSGSLKICLKLLFDLFEIEEVAVQHLFAPPASINTECFLWNQLCFANIGKAKWANKNGEIPFGLNEHSHATSEQHNSAENGIVAGVRIKTLWFSVFQIRRWSFNNGIPCCYCALLTFLN